MSNGLIPMVSVRPRYSLARLGTFVGPTGNVLYVCSAPDNGMPGDMRANLYASINEALDHCRDGTGDVVMVLNGHEEGFTGSGLTNLKAGVTIIGEDVDGHELDWEHVDATWAITAANVRLINLNLDLAGANGVTKAIEVTGGSCLIEGCKITLASDAALKAAIGIEVTETGFQFIGNRVYGTATHNVTNGLILGAGADDCLIEGNVMMASATAANGLIHVTGVALNVGILSNVVYNTHTASTAAIKIDDVAADGVIAGNYAATINDGTATAQGIVFAGASSLFRCFQNFSSDEKNKSGVLTPGAVAT